MCVSQLTVNYGSLTWIHVSASSVEHSFKSHSTSHKLILRAVFQQISQIISTKNEQYNN